MGIMKIKKFEKWPVFANEATMSKPVKHLWGMDEGLRKKKNVEMKC